MKKKYHYKDLCPLCIQPRVFHDNRKSGWKIDKRGWFYNCVLKKKGKKPKKME